MRNYLQIAPVIAPEASIVFLLLNLPCLNGVCGRCVRSVLAERRAWILEGFRSAGFRLVAGVVVEHDNIINQRVMRRDQRLRPGLDVLLEMKGGQLHDPAVI